MSGRSLRQDRCSPSVTAAALTPEAVQQIAPETWRAIAESMERADNVEESHYIERTWAALLAPPLTPSEESAIKK